MMNMNPVHYSPEDKLQRFVSPSISISSGDAPGWSTSRRNIIPTPINDSKSFSKTSSSQNSQVLDPKVVIEEVESKTDSRGPNVSCFFLLVDTIFY